MNAQSGLGVMIVTGASRGIGAAIARLAASRGYAVAVNYRADEIGANKVVGEIEMAGGSAVSIGADIRHEEEIVRLFNEAETALGPLTVLVNNAGISGPATPLSGLAAGDLNDVIGTNLAGTILCSREAVRHMTGRDGAIINVSSTASVGGSAGRYVAYAATKAAIETLTIGLAREVGPLGIRVNAVRPGVIETQMNADTLDSDARARLAASIPLGRLGEPEEVASAVLWLASDEASYVNGSVLRVSGGR